MALDDRLETFSDINNFSFKCTSGSLSDTKYISKFIEGVNLSVGYYEPHSRKEYTNLTELENVITFVKKVFENFSYRTVSYKRMKKINPETPSYSYGSYSYGNHSYYNDFYGNRSSSYGQYNQTAYKKDEKKNLSEQEEDREEETEKPLRMHSNVYDMYDDAEEDAYAYQEYYEQLRLQGLAEDIPDPEYDMEEQGYYTSRDMYALHLCPCCHTDLFADEIPNSKAYAFYCNVCDDYVKVEDLEDKTIRTIYN